MLGTALDVDTRTHREGKQGKTGNVAVWLEVPHPQSVILDPLFSEPRLWRMPAAMPLGERIKLAREFLGYTQQELADRLAMRRETVISWENGHSRPSRATLRQLELILGTLEGPDDLLTIMDDLRHSRPLSAVQKQALLGVLGEQVFGERSHGRHALLPAYPAGFLTEREPCP